MTPKERLVACCRGGITDAKPVIVWSESPGHVADGICVSQQGLADALATHPDQAVLAEVLSPFGRALRTQGRFLQLMHDDPSEGAKRLDALADETKRDLDQCLESGADGIFYRLDGAYPSAATPMEYGGHFLEVDRGLMEGIQEARVNLLWIEGEVDPFLDFVSDIPAHLFGWNVRQSGIAVSAVRAMRLGALCAADPDADVFFTTSFEDAAQLRESQSA